MPKRTEIIKLRAAEQDKQALVIVASALQRSQSDTIRFLIRKAAHELVADIQPASVQA